jgi:nitrilase
MLPEYFCIMGRSDRDKLAVAEAPGEGPIQAMLAETAREHRLWLVAGTLPLQSGEEGRAMNANLVFSPAGEQVARYDKIHLFRYDNGREQYDEGRTPKAGSSPVAFDAAGLRVGLSVCYDLRFPELYRALMKPPCDLLCVPSAFTHPTGLAHWEVLLRAGDREPVLCRRRGPGRAARERSAHLRAQPDRRSLGRDRRHAAEGEGIVAGEVRRERLAEVRAQIPALEHRRGL